MIAYIAYSELRTTNRYVALMEPKFAKRTSHIPITLGKTRYDQFKKKI